MTDRLYYNDAYLKSFDARVTAVSERNGKPVITLDRSAFYPTSGGQPYDTGRINDALVTDVFVGNDGEVWHEVNGQFAPGDIVHGEIDWARRFDHMQQHAADHMIAGAIWRMLGGVTIGLHESDDISTIDVAMPDGRTHLTQEETQRIEWDVNRHIQRDVPIRCWFPDEAELAVLPLRKKPTVKEHVRVVAIGDDEMVACGGTHPSTAGQIGLVKIVSLAPARGKLRVGFVAGERALRDYFNCFDVSHAAAKQFSAGTDKLSENITALRQKLEETQVQLKCMQKEKMLSEIRDMIGSAETVGGIRLIARFVVGDITLAKDCVSKLIEQENVVALMGVRCEKHSMFVFGRSGNVDINMGALLGEAAKALGGKGGGRSDFAQGGGPDTMLEAAVRIIKEKVK